MEHSEMRGVLASVPEQVSLISTAERLQNERRISLPKCKQLKEVNSETVFDGDAESWDRQAQCLIVADGIERIEEKAFRAQGAFRFLVLPNSLKEIGPGAFENCKALESVILPRRMDILDNSCFAGCDKLEYINDLRAVEQRVGVRAFADCTSLTAVELTAQNFGEAAFENCSSLVSCRWDSKANIPKAAFKNCSSLRLFKFHVGLKAIGDEAFDGCVSLEEQRRTISADGRLASGARAGCTIEEVKLLPLFMEHIGHRAFRNCRSIQCLILPWSLKYLGDEAFAGCTNLSILKPDVFHPKELTMGERIFEGCDNILMKFDSNPKPLFISYALENAYPIKLPDREERFLPTEPPLSLVRKGKCVLENQYGRFETESGVLMRYVGPGGRIELPDGIISISYGALGNGYGIDGMCWEYIIIGDELLEYHVGEDGLMRIPAGIKSLRNTLHIHGTLRRLVIPEGVESIGYGVFSCQEHLREIHFPSTLRELGNCAFSECRRLKRVRIPGSVTRIGDCCFEECSRLKWLRIDEGTKWIAEDAFKRCFDLYHVYLPDSLEGISDRSFYGCANLKDIRFGQNIPYIGKRAFDFTPVRPTRKGYKL